MRGLEEAPGPCIVCGAPGGACGPVPGSEGLHRPLGKLAFEEWSDDHVPPKEPTMAGVIATERIFEKLPITNAQERTRKVLRFAPGQVVPDEEAERLGVSADGTQADVPTADTDVSGHVPLVSRTSLVTAEAAPVAGTETTTVAAPEGPQKQAAPKVTTTTTSDAPAKKAPAKRAAKKA